MMAPALPPPDSLTPPVSTSGPDPKKTKRSLWRTASAPQRQQEPEWTNVAAFYGLFFSLILKTQKRRGYRDARGTPVPTPLFSGTRVI
ncbi:unnamed protein product [Arctogadus glacialis]